MNHVPIYKIGEDNHANYIEVVELQERNSYDTSKPHKHEYMEMFLFTKGEGKHEIDFQVFEINSYSVHFVFPNQIHKVNRELDTHGHVVLVSKEYFTDSDYDLFVQFFYSFYLNPTIVLNDDELKKVMHVIQEMKVELSKESPFYESLVKDYVQILIKLFLRFQRQSEHDRLIRDAEFKVYMDLLILVEKNYKKHVPVSLYSDQLQVSARKLNAICKKFGANSCLQVVNDRIVLEARKLLLYGEMSVKEVMFTLNFKDPAYFNRFFKAKTGLTPTTYIIRNTKKYHN